MDDIERAADRAGADRDARTDRGRRRERGIVHTPPALARFVARAVDRALRTRLDRAGLADPDVVVLDPACGPGAFLAAALAVGDGPRAPRRVLGLDLDPAALAQASEVLAAPMAAAGWPLELREADTLASLAPLDDALARGATVAILGNPPWAGRAASRAEATASLLGDFRLEADGSPLRERKVGVLSDDYVRFWRWAAEVARRAEGGAVVGLVTNASFLDGPVHRGMRAALATWFASIDVLDLGGSALIAKARDRKDENVFGVRPAVAVTCAVRPAGHLELRAARVRHASLRGGRKEKLTRLGRVEGFAGLRPKAVLARAPACRFTPVAARDEAYGRWPSITALFPFHREGIQTNRDAFCVDVDEAALRARAEAFVRGEGVPPGKAGEASRHYDPDKARRRLADALDVEGSIRRIDYRPFDRRYVVAVAPVCHRPRPALLEALDRSAFALLTVRKDRGERPWNHVATTRSAVDNCFLSARSSCRTRAFPTHRPDGAPNLEETAARAFTARAGAAPGSEALLLYALAVLASPAYRARFDDALRADYPRLPPPVSEAQLRRAIDAGAALEGLLSEAPGAPEEEIEVGHHRLRVSAHLAGNLRRTVEALDEVVGPALDG